MYFFYATDYFTSFPISINTSCFFVCTSYSCQISLMHFCPLSGIRSFQHLTLIGSIYTYVHDLEMLLWHTAREILHAQILLHSNSNKPDLKMETRQIAKWLEISPTTVSQIKNHIVKQELRLYCTRKPRLPLQ